MSQPNNDHPYETAHLVALGAGEDRAEVSRDIEQYAYALHRIGAGLDAPDPT